MEEEVLDDIGVRFQFLQNGDLTHGRRGHALILVLQLDLLDSHQFLRVAVAGAVDDTIGALSDRLKPLEVIHPTSIEFEYYKHSTPPPPSPTPPLFSFPFFSHFPPVFQQLTGKRSLLPVAVIEDEVAEQVESSFGLVSGHHMSRVVDQCEPEIAGDLGPSLDLPVDRPYLLTRALPLRNALPVQRIQVVQYSCRIDHEIVLSVIDQDSSPAEGIDDIASIGTHDITLEGIVDIVTARHEVYILGDSEVIATVVEEGGEGGIVLAVLPEVESTHSAPIFVTGVVIVGDEVEEGCGLYRKEGYVLVVTESDVLDGFGLEPCAGISEFIGDNTHTVQVGIIVVDLVSRISPTITDCDTLQCDISSLKEGIVVEDLGSEGRDVMSGEGLTSNVEGTGLKRRPLVVEIAEEVQQVISRYFSRTWQRFSLIAQVRKTNSQGLVDEDRMSQDIPRVLHLVDTVLGDPDGSVLGEGCELRTGSWSSLQPQDERHSRIRHGNAVARGGEEGVVHAGLSLGVVPIDLLIACINLVLPE